MSNEQACTVYVLAVPNLQLILLDSCTFYKKRKAEGKEEWRNRERERESNIRLTCHYIMQCSYLCMFLPFHMSGIHFFIEASHITGLNKYTSLKKI